MVVPPTPLHTSRVLTEDKELWDDVKVGLCSVSEYEHKVAVKHQIYSTQCLPTGGNDQCPGHHACRLRSGEDKRPGHVQQPAAQQEEEEARTWRSPHMRRGRQRSGV